MWTALVAFHFLLLMCCTAGQSKFITIHSMYILCTVYCSNGDIRLTRTTSSDIGAYAIAGTVEICFNNQWGSVCGSETNWTLTDAQVVCRQLGYSPKGNGITTETNGCSERIVLTGKLYCTCIFTIVQNTKPL